MALISLIEINQENSIRSDTPKAMVLLIQQPWVEDGWIREPVSDTKEGQYSIG